MSEHNIEMMENGPVLVKGPLTYTDANGAENQMDKPWIALCRCGHSANKPFCDGAHTGKGFQAPKGEMTSG